MLTLFVIAEFARLSCRLGYRYCLQRLALWFSTPAWIHKSRRTQPPGNFHRYTRAKPEWLRAEIIRLKATMPQVGWRDTVRPEGITSHLVVVLWQPSGLVSSSISPLGGQQILALTARKVNDPNTDNTYNSASNWNGGGMHISHDYGFGDVDARAAVRLAENEAAFEMQVAA